MFVLTFKIIVLNIFWCIWFCSISGFEEQTSFGPHVIKVMDEDMLTRVCQKYEKMGHSVQLKTNIIKLNQIKSDTCLQEEVMTNFNAMLLEHTDVTLVSTNNQEVPCHRFILAARSPVFKRYVNWRSFLSKLYWKFNWHLYDEIMLRYLNFGALLWSLSTRANWLI